MDSRSSVKEYEVSDPLKHLLSLDWEPSTAVSKLKDVKNRNNPLKSVKKVRFSDEVLQILCDNSNETLSVLPIYEENENVDTISDEISFLSASHDKHTINMSYDKTEMESPSNNCDEINCKPNERHNLESEILEIQSCADDTTKLNNSINSSNVLKVSDPSDLAIHVQNIAITVSTTENSSLDTKSLKKVPVSEETDNLEGKHTLSQENTNENVAASPLKNRLNHERYNQKQSSKLNSELTKDVHFSNVNELKSAVFKAWCKVKTETELDPSAFVSTNKIIDNDIFRKTNPNDAYLLWKKLKTKALKDRKKITQESLIVTSTLQGKSKEDVEEKEMLFKSWKKQKDEMLKQKMLDEYRSKRQHMVSTLMKKNEKKTYAEEAFSAWKTHKTSTMKIERRKKYLMLQKQKEDDQRKSSRDKEALEMYNLWLEQKHSSVIYQVFDTVKVKPPWIPPGKT